jgi:hypothetical protein
MKTEKKAMNPWFVSNFYDLYETRLKDFSAFIVKT